MLLKYINDSKYVLHIIMAFGANYLRPIFSYGSAIDTPNGCLLNAEGSRLIFFVRSIKSPKDNIEVFTHLFYTNYKHNKTRGSLGTMERAASTWLDKSITSFWLAERCKNSTA